MLSMDLVEKVRLAGIVGAGGGGFPTYIKLRGHADTYIANGAECEPLLHKDAAVMQHRAERLVKGLQLAGKTVGAQRLVIAVKEKKKDAVRAIEQAIQGTGIELFLLPDVYPAGDEYELVYEVTGRLIPPGGIPLNVGVVVNNVETLAQVADAAEGWPVTHKYITIGGAVRQPVTVRVPIGTRLQDLLKLAGGVTVADPIYFIGGLMMGWVTDDPAEPMNKTWGGVVVLSRTHPLSRKRLLPPQMQSKIGKSACDQCRYCTEYCPRYLLGYPVEPHRVMRSLGFTKLGEPLQSEWGVLCCGCGICTMFACPEGLFPKEACDQAKAEFKKAGKRWEKKIEPSVHPMREGRKVPIQRLIAKLAVVEYDQPAKLVDTKVEPLEVEISFRQGAAVAGPPVVKVGDRVAVGQPLTRVLEDQLSVPIHSSIDGFVAELKPNSIVIRR